MKLGSVHHLWDRKGHQRMLVAFHWIFSVHDSCMYPKKSCVKKLLGTPSIFACPLMYSEGGVVEHPRPSACVAAFDEHVDAAASLQGFIFTQNDLLSVLIFHWVWLLFNALQNVIILTPCYGEEQMRRMIRRVQHWATEREGERHLRHPPFCVTHPAAAD